MSQEIFCVDVIKEPLQVVFFYKSGGNKAGCMETLDKSEAENRILADGHKLPEGHEPFFTREEVLAARLFMAENNAPQP
jgi:hypothetical protein